MNTDQHARTQAAINNPAASRRADLISAVHLLRAQLEAAKCEAQGARADYASAEVTIADLGDQLAALQSRWTNTLHDIALVHGKSELLSRLRQLTKDGVACHMQGDVIKHRQTGAILAQIRPA